MEHLHLFTYATVADKIRTAVYADWCGPCKMIAPHFERLSKEYSRPSKVAFAKINVDNHPGIARTYGVTAMPTFLVIHGGKAVNTVKGANPPALSQAVTDALKLGDVKAGGAAGASFKTPGRTLGGETSRTSLTRPSWDINKFIQIIVVFIGLYLVSLFSVCCPLRLKCRYGR
jgi:thioredoxin 1